MAELMGRLIHPELFGPPRAEDFAAPALASPVAAAEATP
jgi:hypothetical protein